MELTLNKEEIVSCCRLTEKVEKQNVDFSWNLPDYCGDIKRIIKCVVEPGISGVSITGDRATAAGEIAVRLIYVNNDEEIDCFEDSAALSVSAQLGETGESFQCLATASVDFVNPRAVSQRRCSISGAISVKFTVIAQKSQPVLKSVDGCGCQQQTKTIPCLNLLSVAEKTFDLSETIELPENEPPADKILFSHADLKLDSKKCVGGKLLIRGELGLDLLYLADGTEKTLVRLSHSLPISQIVEADQLEENSICSVALRLQMLQIRPRSDTSGAGRLLDIAARASALIKAYVKKDQALITDCFATEGTIRTQMKDVDIYTGYKEVQLSSQQKLKIELNEFQGETLLDLRVLKTDCSLQQRDRGMAFVCKADLAMLLQNSEEQISYCERRLEFEIQNESDDAMASVQGDTTLQIQDLQGTLGANNELEISFKSRITAELFSLQREKVCISAQPDETGTNEPRYALTLYFSQKGESVWEIAKHYATSCEAIREENDLRGDTIPTDRMLLVPCV